MPTSKCSGHSVTPLGLVVGDLERQPAQGLVAERVPVGQALRRVGVDDQGSVEVAGRGRLEHAGGCTRFDAHELARSPQRRDRSASLLTAGAEHQLSVLDGDRAAVVAERRRGEATIDDLQPDASGAAVPCGAEHVLGQGVERLAGLGELLGERHLPPRWSCAPRGCAAPVGRSASARPVTGQSGQPAFRYAPASSWIQHEPGALHL
ncbi:MAG TPA: hypothetical protein VG276_04575 [Actinomycetes bacterium]|nr:hypothetical protein [Actinomycetes bacterium]